ncbi:CBS domain-containing protein [Nocardioides campestrisoli]|uniref:CBS domain-containing protein n=1 Tax=Nocardioides campestrisoli TaxID=2736757 RepID=UPI0015E639F1|nr:CBS domain-containing protein [Nocardioides campestrisoli]
MRISDVLNGKSIKEVITVPPDAPVRDLVDLLTEHNVGALVVSHDGRALDGIVSERDVVRRLASDPDLLTHSVRTIMTTDVHTCETTQSLEDLMLLMTQRRIRHVPVVEDGGLVGIISIGDVVKNRIQELEFERDQLDSYVHQS